MDPALYSAHEEAVIVSPQALVQNSTLNKTFVQNMKFSHNFVMQINISHFDFSNKI